MASLHAERTPAAWMMVGNGYWPAPRVVPGHQANADWRVTQCQQCGALQARLVSRETLEAGTPIRVPRSIAIDPGFVHWPWETSADGSIARGTSGRSAGAGAVLWRIRPGGEAECVARAVLAMPVTASAPVAEAHAARLAVLMLVALQEHPRRGRFASMGRRARMLGDNIQAVRYAASQAQLRVMSSREPIDHALEQAWSTGWRLQWQVIRRRHNTAAHSLAKAAAIWAAHLNSTHCHRERIHMQWAGEEQDMPHGLQYPAWPGERDAGIA